MIVTEKTDRENADKILQDQIDGLTTRMGEAEKRISDLEYRMLEAERQIKLLWEKLSDTEARVSALESKLYREVEPALHDLEEKVGDVEEDIKGLKSRLDDVETRIKTIGGSITATASSTTRPDGASPQAPGDVQIELIDAKTSDGQSNTTVTFESKCDIYTSPGEEFWTYTNILPVNYGTGGQTVSLSEISVSGGQQLDMKAGYAGNPDGIPEGYAIVKIKAPPSGGIVTVHSKGAVDVTGYDPNDWIPDRHDLADALNRLNFAGGQQKLFPNAGAYAGRIQR